MEGKDRVEELEKTEDQNITENENEMEDVTADEMKEVTGGSGAGGKTANMNDPRCMICSNILQPVLSHFVCVNPKCSEFGKKKNPGQVKR